MKDTRQFNGLVVDIKKMGNKPVIYIEPTGSPIDPEWWTEGLEIGFDRLAPSLIQGIGKRFDVGDTLDFEADIAGQLDPALKPEECRPSQLRWVNLRIAGTAPPRSTNGRRPTNTRPDGQRTMRPKPTQRRNGGGRNQSPARRNQPRQQRQPQQRQPQPAPNRDTDWVIKREAAEIVKLLNQPMSGDLVAFTYDNLPHITGYNAINQANRIFGFGGWSYDVVENGVRNAPVGVNGETAPLYWARVRVSVPALEVERTDVGFGDVAAKKEVGPREAGHEKAMKGAVTDGLKRCLRTFGSQFGNDLYRKTGGHRR